MLSKDEALEKLNEVFPGREIQKSVEYNGKFIFLAIGSDPSEGFYDPYISVDQTTGEVLDFSLLTEEGLAVSKLFEAA